MVLMVLTDLITLNFSVPHAQLQLRLFPFLIVYEKVVFWYLTRVHHTYNLMVRCVLSSGICGVKSTEPIGSVDVLNCADEGTTMVLLNVR